MSQKPDRPHPLRTAAEAELAQRKLAAAAPAPTAEKLLHELQVHQIELEMQNEELRRAQNDLEESRDRYAYLYDFAPVGYLVLTESGLIDEINLTGAAMLGEERQRLVKRRFARFVAAEDRDRWYHFCLGALQHDDRQSCELAMQRADGSRFHVMLECMHTAIAGVAPSLRISLVDLTERKQTEELLSKSTAEIADLYNNTPCGYHSLDKDGIIRQINDTELAWLGYTRDEMIGRMKLYDLMTPASKEIFRENYPRFMKQGFVHNLEFEMIRRDGTIFTALVFATAIYNASGDYVMSRSSLLDITERKKLEREIKERRKEMEKLQKQHVAAQTAAAIAHELNQPLLAIASYSDAARMLLKNEKPDLDKIRKAVEATERQAHRAGKSIRELVDLLGMEEFPTEIFDLNREILDALNTARSENELQFNSFLRLEDGLPLVQANRTHVQKVLLNLLNNGIEAMLKAGVPLPAITVTVHTAKGGRFAQVTIQDNGPGFKEEDIQHLFESFFTTKASGIGMGLSVSRSLIEANGGQLWVDPQAGPGATFHLTLPFAP